MNGSHSGNGTVKSVNRKAKYARYNNESRREANRDRRARRIARGFRKAGA